MQSWNHSSITIAPLRFLSALLVATVLSACTTIAYDQPRTESHVYTDTETTVLGKSLQKWKREHPGGESAFFPLVDGLDALGARLRLVEAAERSIDAQYFLMKDDDAGEVFAGSLLNAADRGVRVRFLLDDVFTTVEDDILALLDRHPNIEIRLYNPVSRRGIYYLNYAGDFDRANRRMHSKSLTADNAYSIIGGRNIADEYFKLRGDTEFLDYDVLTMGPVVPRISEQFDDFWNNPRSIPISQLEGKYTEEDLARERAEIEEERSAQARSIYERALNTGYLRELVDGTGRVYTAPAALLSDGAAKLDKPIDVSHMTLIQELVRFLDKANESILVINPYFLPTESGMAFWRRQIERGLEVTVVTNSLASTNHIPVHSGYSRYREGLLEMGVNLHEVRVDAVRAGDGDGADTPDSLTLHTKLMVIDNRYLFVGSLNLDPRSLEINAEMGVLIDSEEMVRDMAPNLKRAIATSTYRVELDEQGRLRWLATIDGKPVVETHEPLTNWWRRFLAGIYRVLPEEQL